MEVDTEVTGDSDLDEDTLDFDQEPAEVSLPAREVDDSDGQSLPIPASVPLSKKKTKSNWPHSSGEFRYGEFVGRGTDLFILKKDKSGKLKEKRFANLVFIKETQQNIDDGMYQIVLRYWFIDQWHELKIKRSQLQVNELTKLLDYGVDVPNHKVRHIAKFLSLHEDAAPLKKVHKKLGWAKHDGALVYKHQKMIGSNLPYSSEYVDDLSLQKGTYAGWKQVIEQEVLGYIPLEFALVCGFASPLISLIARFIDIEVLMFHIFGDSSQGKTSALRVFISPFALPSKQEGGLILQWHGTLNGLVAQIKEKHGIPITLDEASMNRMNNFTEFLYLLAEGREKARMTKEVEERKRESWSGIVFSTAEHSLKAKSNQNAGLSVRLQEIGNIKWTTSPDNAKKIKEGLFEHYGHAGPRFVEYLLRKGKDDIIERWKKWSTICCEKMEYKDGLSARIADRFALILATAELMNELFDFQVNIDGILAFLLKMDQENIESRDLGERAYQYLKQKVVEYQAHFIMDGAPPSRDCMGRITRHPGKGVEVEIMKEPFRRLIHEGGFDDSSVVLQSMKAKGYMDHEEKKLTRKRKIEPDKPRIDVHIFLFDDSLLEMLKREPLPSSFVTSKTKPVGKRRLDDAEDYTEVNVADLD
ncbi:DUF927 domain-containing protein [Brevibacillus ruminantium]|uniref:DUF927 domain-containing protein n=1 Tax=Brevibacillus ruminantium TaxID=2950604 RepID=A0ABY4WEP5_9BACL|nr:DUF927 domain-containing protein [Brevibacillus ruminantium]USG65364.1 DUF927 domain-containing protein [Brevibacillus ruminantium]